MTLERTYRLRSGEVLASLRKSARLSQRDLADAAGVTRGAISHLELGRRHGVERRHADDIADRLNVPLAVLFDVPLPPAPSARSPHGYTATSPAQRWPARQPRRRPAGVTDRRA